MSDSQAKILVTGASSSGKSEFAEALAAKTDKSVIYLATATRNQSDREWQSKILEHQQRRPAGWKTVETSTEIELELYIERALKSECLLIDSLGTWAGNYLELDRVEWQQKCDRLLLSLQASSAEIILVGEETGWGIVPVYASGRLFRDRLGDLSRKIANVVDVTYLVAGGHILNLSLIGEPLSKYGI